DEQRRRGEKTKTLRDGTRRDLGRRFLIGGQRQRLDQLVHALEDLHAARERLSLLAHLLERAIRGDRRLDRFGDGLPETDLTLRPFARDGIGEDREPEHLAAVA